MFQQWFKDDYFGSDYNAVDENDAAAAYAKGKGVFYLGGNWQAAVIKTGLKDNAGFMNMPPGPSGKYVAIGATSLPVAHLLQDEVPGRRRGLHQLARSPHRARPSCRTPRTRSRPSRARRRPRATPTSRPSPPAGSSSSRATA